MHFPINHVIDLCISLVVSLGSTFLVSVAICQEQAPGQACPWETYPPTFQYGPVDKQRVKSVSCGCPLLTAQSLHDYKVIEQLQSYQKYS